MKIVLLQLPLQGHDFFFSRENIPLAAAYLREIAARQGAYAELVPQHLMSYGDDQAILRFLLDKKPDIIGMSCYGWNIERSLFLAEKVKQELPRCTVVLGGPEIVPDNEFLLQHESFDVGVVGEGEPSWEGLLHAFPDVSNAQGLLLRRDGKWRYTGANSLRLPLDRCPSPFLSGSLHPQLKEVLWLETVRGCVHRCAYCYYHKAFARVKIFPLERILAEVQRARETGIREIVLLDPCFSRRPNLNELLDALCGLNSDRALHFSAECNVEDIDRSMAEKLSKTGFKQMEVGLQSVKADTLKRIHRHFEPKRFLQGVKYLQDQGIEVIVDLIAGLPGDRLQDIRRSLDWVVKHEAYDSLMLYPLNVLPATEVRRRADEWGLCAMPEPPYLITKGRGLSAADLCEAFKYYEACMGEDITPLEMPPGLDPWPKHVSPAEKLSYFIEWRVPEEIRTISQMLPARAYAFTLKIGEEVLAQPAQWLPVLTNYLEKNPFTLLSVEVPPEVFPEQLTLLWRLASKRHHFLERDYTVTHTPYRSLLVFSRSQGLLWKWPDPREAVPQPLPDGQHVDRHPVCVVAGIKDDPPDWFLEHLRKRYPRMPEIRLWQPADDE